MCLWRADGEENALCRCCFSFIWVEIYRDFFWLRRRHIKHQTAVHKPTFPIPVLML